MVGVQKRKIQWAISLFLMMLYFYGLTAQAQYGGGSGAAHDPYLIYTAEQMNTIGAEPNDWDKHFKLMADIDLSSYTGEDYNIIGELYYDDASGWVRNPFTGVFNGNGHTISNFSYTSTDTNRIGLFGYVRWPAQIKDLGLLNPNVDAGTGDSVGSLVGELRNGTISSCYVEGGSVSGNGDVGRLVGSNFGTITTCYSNGVVTGHDDVGGLVGFNNGTITNCYSTGSVSGNDYAGGLVGDNGGTITNCYSNADVTGKYDVGGLVGENYDGGTITNCYATGSVSGWEEVGGLVGQNGILMLSYPSNPCTILNCYSTGFVSGKSNVGGLVGENGYGTVTGCFWDIETSGLNSSAGGKERTTGEMQDPNTFIDAGWDFAPHDIWVELLGGGYPVLSWQLPPLVGLPSFSGGTGEPDDHYLISTVDELNSIGHNPRLMTAHFRLVNDIDLTGVDFFIIGNELFPFAGVFDGNGKKIYNFSYTSTDRDYVGLFGYVDEPNAEIKDLGLIDPNVDAGTGGRVGSLVGYISRGTITGCYAEGGSVSGVGGVSGLVGENYGKITDCYSTSSVTGAWSVGGLLGLNYGAINNCYATSNISGGWYVGGLVGYNRGTISNCYSTGSVSGRSNIGVGGLVGSNDGTITNCCATGSVEGDERVGGMVGWNWDGTITNCYSTGSVTGTTNVGGLIGQNGYIVWSRYAGTIYNCYATGSVAGTTNVGGLVGYNELRDVMVSFWDTQTSGQATSDGGTGKITAEMQMESTFTDAGWDFVGESINGMEDIWWILEGQDYPRLWWELIEE